MPSLSADHLAPASGGFEPQRAYDFFLYLNAVEGAETIRLAIDRAFLPSEANEEISLSFGNERVYVAGPLVYRTGALTVRDMVDKDTYGLLRAWRDNVHNPATGNTGMAAAYKKTGRIVLVAPDNSSSRSYQLTGLWPVSLSPSELSYTTPNVLNVEVICRFDKALRS